MSTKKRADSSPPPLTAKLPRKKSARLNLRLEPDLKAMLEEAAAVSDSTLSEFCLASVRSAAEKKLRAAATIRLRGRDAKAFFEALVNPPAPNPALERAAAAHAERVVDD